MDKIWKSKLHRSLKIQFFRATVEGVLLNGAESWTLAKEMNNQLDGTYTRMLRATLGFTWRDHKTNKEQRKQRKTQQHNNSTTGKEVEVHRAHVEEKGRNSKSNASLGSEAGNKEEGKTCTYICGPAKEKH